MTHATSPFLNRTLRSEGQAHAEIEEAREQAKRERQRRLEEHGSDFCRMILDGAFERIYRMDGSYVLQPVQSTLDNVSSHALPDDCAAKRLGYAAALRDLSCWIANSAAEPKMDSATLMALNREIARLSQRC